MECLRKKKLILFSLIIENEKIFIIAIFILKYYIVVTNGLLFGEKDVSKLLNYFSVGNGYASVVSEDI